MCLVAVRRDSQTSIEKEKKKTKQDMRMMTHSALMLQERMWNTTMKYESRRRKGHKIESEITAVFVVLQLQIIMHTSAVPTHEKWPAEPF